MIIDGQERLDGHKVESWQARFTGTMDLDVEEAEKMGLDRVVVWIVASRVGQSEFKVLGDSGEVRRKNVINLEDARVLTGAIREQAILFLRSGDQAALHLTPPVEPAEEWPAHGEVRETADSNRWIFDAEKNEWLPYETGPVAGPGQPEPESETAVDEPVADLHPEGEAELPADVDFDDEARVIERKGPVVDDSPPRPDGPKVGRFDPATGEPGDAPVVPAAPAASTTVGEAGTVEDLGDRQVIGSVYGPGHTGKDKHLAAFLEGADI